MPTLDVFPYCQGFCQELPRDPDLGILGLQKLPKPCVVGSNPTGGADTFDLARAFLAVCSGHSMVSVGIQAAHRPQDLPAGRVLPAAREALSDVLRLRQPEVGIHPRSPHSA